ncbi:MAG TPA: helix-turn-helix transcriptional regulator, partial [Thermoanaerobaculia bacterium]|nr:helix-turn-helix transcriptional regulator [Thermoanaerobaculia bacterium]
MSPPPAAVALRYLREEAGWTQTALEGEAGLGRGVVSKLERGVQRLQRSELAHLARILGFDEGWVDRTLAACEQLPRLDAPSAALSALTPSENRAVAAATVALSRFLRAEIESNLGGSLVAQRWAADREAAGAAWRRLVRLPTAADRRALVPVTDEFHTWAVCERLCEESIRAAANDI